ncbi:DUF262 domain-containing protein [Empedobacter tilapiae]|uniref:DUF262 domain-containing protein n=1 Tax=Empedobacter tilapiae TaxID=2491114 RepID=A0A4Z1BCW4_9FLAO|nr:DUF262 domain-containing protein [Empedobacter tilapiae]TGN26464.1 DUF262 domain-containing protein [Empedobacter tilapiae]
MKEKNSIAFIPLNHLKSKHFVVKEYQRGYKWESEQILALLNDIDYHKTGKYCLQPIITDESNNEIELIDGQQRITTLYLLLHFLDETKFYTIDYQTRRASQTFINNELSKMSDAIVKNKDWETFISSYSDIDNTVNFNNVDIYHFYLVYKEIFSWFNEKSEEFKNDFRLKILNQVYVIWYDIKNNNRNLSAEDVFLNLNAGKIPLTNSELIKALFILDIQKRFANEIATLKSVELAAEWDNIENQLHESEFWFFICDHVYYNNLDTRIDLVIDLTNKISPKKDWDGMEAYRIYENEFIKENQLNWENIKQTFNKLDEWYRDKELYHFVGYIIVSQIKKLSEIIKLSSGKSKIEFKDILIKIIKSELNKSKKLENNLIQKIYDLDVINYEDHPLECKKLLLLLNVQYFLNNSSHNKFPFNLYRNESWSVEHINPQNPKTFKTVGQIVKWLKSFEVYYEKYPPIHLEIIQEIKDLHNLLSNSENENKKLSELKLEKTSIEKLQNVIDKITNDLDLHSIANLTLLDRNTNSKLGNNIFLDKRKVLLDLYYTPKEKGVFIPECTKDVFTKNFSKENENISDELFSLKDMSDYKEHLKKQLKLYYQ